MKSEKGFFRQKRVLIVISIGLTCFFWSAYKISLRSDWDIWKHLKDGNFEIINTNYGISIAILQCVIVLLGVLAIDYRANQTSKQIVIAQSQNAFSNYYKHLEEFEKYISASHPSDEKLKEFIRQKFNTRLIHKNLFPGSYDGTSYEVISLINSQTILDTITPKIMILLESYRRGGDSLTVEEADVFRHEINNITYGFDMVLTGERENLDVENAKYQFAKTESMVAMIIYKSFYSLYKRIEIIDFLSRFDANYTSKMNYKYIHELKLISQWFEVEYLSVKRASERVESEFILIGRNRFKQKNLIAKLERLIEPDASSTISLNY